VKGEVMDKHTSGPYQPKIGQPCYCKPGIQRDNCPACEGTGQRIDFEAIRARTRAAFGRDERKLTEETVKKARAAIDKASAIAHNRGKVKP
jgi:hypothetical protein